MRVDRSSSAKKPGFTLVELMVVILLIGIMTAMILPEMRGAYEDALLRSTARKLVDVFQFAHSRAITLNREHRFRLDEKTGHYVLERSGGEGEARFVAVKDEAGGEGDLDTRITVKMRMLDEEPAEPEEAGAKDSRRDGEAPMKPYDTIVFRPDGGADPGEVLLKDRDGFRVALRVNPSTSRVEIVEADRE